MVALVALEIPPTLRGGGVSSKLKSLLALSDSSNKTKDTNATTNIHSLPHSGEGRCLHRVRGNSFTITTKPLSFYILATIVIFTILSIITISLRLAMVGATEDSGVATISSVDITQAGTGQSVTIDGTVLDEAGEDNPVDNASRRTILNNNVVRYSANYLVTTPGTITLSITLPANNTIDEATIGTAQGCLTGSKLEQVTVDGKQSYTNNKATCVMNATTNGRITWGITAYLWGGNNTAIQPTMSIGNVDQDIKPDPITVMGKAELSLLAGTGNSQGASNGWNRDVVFELGLNVPISSETGILGVDPTESVTINFDMSGIPDGWEVDYCSSGVGGNNFNIANSGGLSADVSCNKVSDDVLAITMNDVYAARLNYATSISSASSGRAYYVVRSFRIRVPVAGLSSTSRGYTIAPIDPQFSSMSGQTGLVNVVYNGSLHWSLSSSSYGVTYSWFNWFPGSMGGHISGQPFYVGENITLNIDAQYNVVPTSSYATDYEFCTTWNPTQYYITGEYVPRTSNLGSSVSAKYGVIGNEINARPSSSIVNCVSQGHFFDSLEEARSYANSVDMEVNALYINSDRLVNGRDIGVGTVPMHILDNQNDTTYRLLASSRSADWSGNTDSSSYQTLVPGLLSHTITAKPSSTSPNTEDHITITPKTYNKDTNTKITVNLPSNLTPKDNSFYVSTYRLIKDLDYTITKASNGGYTITFNTDQIATHSNLPITGEPAIMPGEPGNNTDLPIAKDNNGSGITRPPIEFDVLVDSNTPTPSTLTITSQVSGTGTNYASTTFKSASADIAIATREEFGYSMSSNASSIYAGDNLSYTLTNTNTLDDPTTNLTTINVLPYDGDSRGTVGLKDYQLAKVRLSSSVSDASDGDLALYYTTDNLARQLELSDPASLVTDTGLTWHKLTTDSNTNGSYTIPLELASQITALKYTKSTLASGESITLTYTLTNIQATGSEAEPGLIGNSISYTMADVLSSPATNASTVTTSYLGNLLRLSLDKDVLVADVDPGTVHIGNGDIANPDNLTNTLNLVARTTNGYNLTMQSATEETSLTMNLSKDTVDDTTKTYTIPTIDTKPTKGSTGWSITFGNPNDSSNTNWHALPASTTTPLAISTTTIGGNNSLTLPVTYGVAVAPNTIAGTYTNRVVYTVTAGI